MGNRAFWAGILLLAAAFASVALHARGLALGYELARLRARERDLEREVERLRYECASEARPARVLARARKDGLDHRAPPRRRGREGRP